mmetsp:Transcript_5006/g.10059  ORF Transcript_5006/g.10059 Transcript_5006/m.10059 type:complete len:208 (-) Transcript_5006:166-789(-)
MMTRLVSGETIFLRGPFHLSPSRTSAFFTIARVKAMRYFVIHSIGRSTRTAKRLKQSCTVAAAKANLSSSAFPRKPMDTIVLVTEVPMLAPMMMKIAILTSRTLAPTRDTTIEVVVELDWTKTVAIIPMHKPAIGFSTPPIRLPVLQEPTILAEVPKRSRPKRKKYRKNKARKLLKITDPHDLESRTQHARATSFQVASLISSRFSS